MIWCRRYEGLAKVEIGVKTNFHWKIFDGGFTGIGDHLHGRGGKIWETVLRENGFLWVVKTQGMGEVSQRKWSDWEHGAEDHRCLPGYRERACENGRGWVDIFSLWIIYFLWWTHLIIMDPKSNI